MFLPDPDQAPAGATSLPTPLPPIRAWEYLRMRREAAGLTIAQSARPHWKNPAHREDVERNLAHFEQPGVVIKPWFAGDMNRAFPFDALIYRQLAEDPPHQHPRLCRTCGWDEWTEANDLQGNSITWGEAADTCTRCEQRRERERGAQTSLPLDRAA